MRIIADLHVHSKYSRATSSDMHVEKLNYWAKLKGINVIGTGDFTHPLYFTELKQKLEPAEPGLYKFKHENSGVRFLLTTEISNIFNTDRGVKKIHTLILAPDLNIVEKINTKLGMYGKLSSDGRPIFGFNVRELVKLVLDISPDCLIVPAHAWTPWFSIFGSKSGFDAIVECFGNEAKFIYAIETGLSSDPSMNWRISALDKVSLISNSDAHSPGKIGREANVFNCELDYYDIVKTIKEKNKEKFLFTIEFFPEEGKYHLDGHRVCNVSMLPKESIKNNNRCPVCKREITVGVLHRVEELADREDGFIPENAIPEKHFVPLEEIIAEALEVKTGTKRVEEEYMKIVNAGGSELSVLMDLPVSDLTRIAPAKVAEGIKNAREGRVSRIGGYDGVYGKISVFPSGPGEEEKEQPENKQMKLFI
jgi:uncharacterized protein (TIGR00375 family)